MSRKSWADKTIALAMIREAREEMDAVRNTAYCRCGVCVGEMDARIADCERRITYAEGRLTELKAMDGYHGASHE